MSLHYPPRLVNPHSYEHVQFANGTWQAICPLCCLPVGLAKTEILLEREEEDHVCAIAPRKPQIGFAGLAEAGRRS